jgi:hypothetical protein
MVLKSNIEILPWSHDIQKALHHDLLSYLRSLPKGSTVCIEGSKELFDFALAVGEAHANNSPLKVSPPKYLAENVERAKRSYGDKYLNILFSNFSSLIDVANVVRSRGFKAVNLETFSSEYSFMKGVNRAKSDFDRFLWVTGASIKREENMASIIRNTIVAKKGKPIYVVVGSMHAFALSQMLSSAGEKVVVNREFMGELPGKVFLSCSKLEAERRRAYLAKDMQELSRIHFMQAKEPEVIIDAERKYLLENLGTVLATRFEKSKVRFAKRLKRGKK